MTTAPLKAADIYAYLPADTPWDIKCFDLLDSTSTYLQHITEEENAKGFTAVIADEQTAGRGRLGRPWHSPAGSGLWISLMFRPEFDSSRAPSITLMVAVAVAQALEDMGVKCGIKWPNDIFSPARRKLCGIRCEMHCDMESVDYVIVGIGINVYQEKFPAEISAIATSMHQVSGETAPRAEIAAAVLDAFEENYQLLCAEGFAPIRAKWLEYNCCVGRRLTVTDERQAPQTGLCCGIDEQGYLLLETAAGVTRITGGDIIL